MAGALHHLERRGRLLRAYRAVRVPRELAQATISEQRGQKVHRERPWRIEINSRFGNAGGTAASSQRRSATMKCATNIFTRDSVPAAAAVHIEEGFVAMCSDVL